MISLCSIHFRLFVPIFFFFRFDANKSTKGASKLRRDLINTEIANLRDLLPLPPSTRQRLSQLQLMALVCVYVRKANYFQQGNTSHVLYPIFNGFSTFIRYTIYIDIDISTVYLCVYYGKRDLQCNRKSTLRNREFLEYFIEPSSVGLESTYV